MAKTLVDAGVKWAASGANLEGEPAYPEWQGYTPTWTAEGATQPTLGNGVLKGRYVQMGKTVTATVFLGIGSTTVVTGTSTWRFTLPVTAADSQLLIGVATILDAGTDNILAAASAVNTTTVAIIGEAINVVSGNTPMVWATNDALKFVVTYEAAG
jgi:hypothetical protein